jgi:acetyltransferase
MTQLNTLFNPNSVAIVGACNDESKVGYALMKNVINGKAREVYPVTLNEKVVLDHVAYKSVKEIPGKIDLVIIAIRADIVSSILKECAEKEVRNVIVISAGFKEAGENGKKMETEMSQTAKELGINLLGPNCLGIINSHANWNASFAVNKPKKGYVSFVSQSGALGTALLDRANKEGVGFSKFVSLGNEAVLTELDFLEYLADDDETKAILLYLEKVTDGTRFLELARKITEKKPLVVLRAGRSARGSAAVASHTGSLAPSDKVFEAALKQVGAIPVNSIRTLFSLAKLFELEIFNPLQNLAIVTNGGGPSVNTTDLIETSKSLSMATLTEDIKNTLKKVLPPMAAVNNPIDVIGDAGPSRYDDTLNILTEIEEIDAIITLVTPQMMTNPVGIAEVIIKQNTKKPVIPVFMGGETIYTGVEFLKNKDIVNFDSPTNLVDALDALAKGVKKPEIATKSKVSHNKFSMMDFEKMDYIMKKYDLNLEGEYIKEKEGIKEAIQKLGDGPYALKAFSDEIIHKTDSKAVYTNLTNEEQVENAWEKIKNANDGLKINGMMLQKMINGIECIVGMKRDSVFGPVVVFGLGGIFVEIIKDSSMRIAPVTENEALRQINEIKGIKILKGARGKEPANLQALAKTISLVSKMSLEHEEIKEIDFNPIFVTHKGVHIVDARVMK